jgi:DNA topoisomerase-1
LAKALVIVESPAKAKTINKYLGREFDVEASLGHVKDLPKKTLGVDVDNDFETEYTVIPGKEKVLGRLKKLARTASAIYLAPDPDREGEAIAAHLAQELTDGAGKKKKKNGIPVHRVTFNEITKKAVQEAFEHPREIDQNLVDAQQTRRVLDRLVGYQISPLLWDKVRRGISAGRVQTVALRLIVERERDIKAFQKVEYWTLDAHLHAAKPPLFDASFVGANPDKNEIPNEEAAQRIQGDLEKADWVVRNVEKKERRRSAAPPFTTSKFQQDASRKLRFSVKRAMMIAQRLYEGIDLGDEGSVGLITYMRTDSTRVSNDALGEVREYITSNFGEAFLPESPNFFKSKKGAQDAHEAVRPTSAMRHPDAIKRYLQEDEFKVYKLIWQRFVASQMNPAVFDQTSVDIAATAKSGKAYPFRVTGSVLKFEGFLKVYEESHEGKTEEEEELRHKLPPLEVGQKLELKGLKPEQHFTEPPPRFNEASLVKELEERGIGRPSTYAAIISTIQERGYVLKGGGKFAPTEIGMVVTDLLVTNFPDIFDLQYTARLEEELDEIEEGKEKWTDALAEFYKKFAKDLRYAEKHMENIKRMEKPTEEKCERCGSPLVIKWGKHGSFFACSAYSKDDPNSCTFTKENPIDLPDLDSADMQETSQEEYCENCGRLMVLKRGRFGQFMACTGYPECKTTRRLDQGKRVPDIPLEEKCPQCGRNMILRHGRFGEFVSCSGYPECKYIKQNFIGMKCPKCKEGEIVEKKARKRGNLFYGCGNYPKCDFTSNWKPVDEKCPQCGNPYLVEKKLRSGTVIACPNNKRAGADEDETPKRRKKKNAGEDEAEAIRCDYSRPVPEPAPVA